MRDKKSLFRTKEEAGLVPYDSVIAEVDHLLEDYDFDGLRLKYMRPEKTAQVLPLIQTLLLKSIDLRQCTRMSPDRFHDVAGRD
jgi:hypothetical protein